VSYAQGHPVGGSRTFAIALVALTHASLGYAITTGLAYTVIQKAPGTLKTFDVEERQPPAQQQPWPWPDRRPMRPRARPAAEHLRCQYQRCHEGAV